MDNDRTAVRNEYAESYRDESATRHGNADIDECSHADPDQHGSAGDVDADLHRECAPAAD